MNRENMEIVPERRRKPVVVREREQYRKSYHATPDDIEEYVTGLQKGITRMKLKEVQMATDSGHSPSSHKKGPE